MNISIDLNLNLRFVCFQYWKLTKSSSFKNIIKAILTRKIETSLRKFGIPNTNLTKFNMQLMIRKYISFDVTVGYYIDGPSML